MVYTSIKPSHMRENSKMEKNMDKAISLIATKEQIHMNVNIVVVGKMVDHMIKMVG